MRKIPNLVFTIFMVLVGSSTLKSQEISAIVKDSITKQIIPFSSIYLSSGEGVITNNEGKFRIQRDSISEISDSIFISCMGYKTLGYPLASFKDSIVLLPSKSIALGSIILSNKKLEADEIIKAIKKDIPNKYELGITKKKLFFRQSGIQEFKTLQVKVKKSSIKELSQSFWDSTLKKVPRKGDWHIEVLGDLYGDYSRENQKLELHKALELEDKKVTAIFENIEKVFDTILKQNVKPNSYFKLRAGIISTRLDEGDLQPSELDTLSVEEKSVKQKEYFLNGRKNRLARFFDSMIEKENLDIDVLEKSSKYNFKQTDFTYFGNIPVYVLKFIPKGNTGYSGSLYVDADQMALMRMEYKNVNTVKDFSLFGLFYNQYRKEVIIQFKKMKSGKYAMQYFEYINQFEAGAERSFTIVEKNKTVKGRNKQNELKIALNIKTDQLEKFQAVIFETETISQEAFDDFEEKPTVTPVNLIKYDPAFWKGFNIIEPNQAIKDFKGQ